MKITQNLHMHTSLSSCAVRDASVAGYVEDAVNDGQLKLLGFTDHLWDGDVPGATRWYSPQNVEHVLQLKKEIPESREMNGIKLLFGCETEFINGGILCLTEEHAELFDYLLVPHSHCHMNVVMPREYAEDHKLYAKFLMDSFMRLVTHPMKEKITIAAHPFVAGTSHAMYNTIQSNIPNSYFYEAFAAAKEADIAIEMNGSCLVYLPEEEIPNCEYVRIFSIAKECGCRFTYGSDAHDHRHGKDGRKLHLVERFFDQCGITEADMVDMEKVWQRVKK